MPIKSSLDWFTVEEKLPPKHERLLLIVSAAGDPPTHQLIGKSEIAVGKWDGDRFVPVSLEPSLGLNFKPSHWATLRNLPENVILQDRF
jgi:hypothetical protein